MWRLIGCSVRRDKGGFAGGPILASHTDSSDRYRRVLTVRSRTIGGPRRYRYRSPCCDRFAPLLLSRWGCVSPVMVTTMCPSVRGEGAVVDGLRVDGLSVRYGRSVHALSDV